MRSFFLTSALAATFALTASAQNCNPSYNTPSAGPCFASCNEQAGKTFYSGWTSDPSSPNFLKSLTLMCNKGTSEYMAFMTKAGICMVSCANPELFNQEFASACAWWGSHKNDACDASKPATTEPAKTTEAVTTTPPVTTTVAPSTTAAETTTAAATTTSAPSESSTVNPAVSIASSAASVISSAVSSAVSNATSVASSAPVSSSVPSASQSGLTANQTPSAANSLKAGSATVAAALAVAYLAL